LVTGLDRAVELYATEDIAINTFKEDKAIEDIKKMQLRRRFKRLPLDIKVELKASSGKGPVCFNGDILNLSAVGAYIYGCDQFKLGDQVILRLKLPPKMEEIELAAKVVWICDKQIQPHMYPGIGVAFSDVSSSLQGKIIEFIERNLSFMSSDDQE
jgi:Tfp pilus assembly protein PilZ